MKLKMHKKKATPLCFLPDGRLVCYQWGHILIIDNGLEVDRIKITVPSKERILGWSRFATRLFRFGVRTAIAVDENLILLSIGNRIHELDLTTRLMTSGWFCGEGIRPLAITHAKGVYGFRDGLYFGGYLGNRVKRPVHIYYRTGRDSWSIIYTFSQGEINHIHNIVVDSYRNCFWVFTGDFDEASAIWKITDGFKLVERFLFYDQKYRGCVAFAVKEGLLYATDAPFINNCLYLLNPGSKELREVYPIHGSCIYGCKWKDLFVFSSTVEGDGRILSRKELLFSRKRGVGIKDNFVHLYIGNLKDGFKEVYSEEKDCLPLYSFQFGVFKFPCGDNDSNRLFFQPVATRKNDLRLMSIMDI